MNSPSNFKGARRTSLDRLSRSAGTAIPAWLASLRARRRSQNLLGFAVSSLSVAVVVSVWIWFSNAATSNIVPTPDDVLAAARQLAFRGYAGGTLLRHEFHSVTLALMAFLAAVTIAVPLGVMTGIDRRIDAAFEPILALLRPIPPLAWVPIAIIWFGLGDTAKIFVIFFTAFVPAFINTHAAVRGTDPGLIDAARVHGARGWTLVSDVIFPASLPMIFIGLRISLQASWMTLVAAELVGAFFGLGRVLSIAAQDIYPGMIAVAMVAVALTGAVMDNILIAVERALLPWLRSS